MSKTCLVILYVHFLFSLSKSDFLSQVMRLCLKIDPKSFGQSSFSHYKSHFFGEFNPRFADAFIQWSYTCWICIYIYNPLNKNTMIVGNSVIPSFLGELIGMKSTIVNHWRTRRLHHREINQEWLGSGAGGNEGFFVKKMGKNYEELGKCMKMLIKYIKFHCLLSHYSSLSLMCVYI